MLANVYYNLKDYDKAIGFYKKAIEDDPKNTNANNGLGNVYSYLKDYNKAIEFYKKSIEADPKFAPAYANLGNVYSSLKDYDKAIAFYYKSIEADPKFAYAYNGLGNVYSDLKDYNKAIKFYKKAIEADLKFEYVYNNLGNVYSDLKDYNKAIEFYNKSIEADPKFAPAYSNLGNVYSSLKDYDKAIEFYSKSIEVDPKDAYSYYWLGSAYYQLKKYNESLIAFEKYVDLNKYEQGFYINVAISRIEELKKLIENEVYSKIRELVDIIKNLLLHEGGCITHYTSLSVTKILVTEGSLFRLSEGAFLNDTSEGRELFEFLDFQFPVQNKSDTVAKPFAQKPFIGSFVSENKHDDLTLWRMYGKEAKEEAKGCAITIDMKKLLENFKESLTSDTKSGNTSRMGDEFSLYKVAYLKEGKKTQFIIRTQRMKVLRI